jgi:hypothetical protein
VGFARTIAADDTKGLAARDAEIERTQPPMLAEMGSLGEFSTEGAGNGPGQPLQPWHDTLQKTVGRLRIDLIGLRKPARRDRRSEDIREPVT